MPRKDGTGPDGKGPKTGRGKGNCRNRFESGDSGGNQDRKPSWDPQDCVGKGRGQGRGRGRGRGRS